VPLVSAISPSGILQSTVRIDDGVWTESGPEIRAAFAARGYTWEIEEFAESGEVDRNCTQLGEVLAWLCTLNPEED